ncbi:hypothetical protein JW826_06115 [Candidatus Woesearchaeota archaeon]|nr:hypothetical protein [Candidatus Woesearchaeota archaeon]
MSRYLCKKSYEPIVGKEREWSRWGIDTDQNKIVLFNQEMRIIERI